MTSPRGNRKRTIGAAIATVVALAASLLAGAGTAAARTHVPVVFVHGQSGSAQQFQSNAQRFSGNGYADDRLFAYEYDTNVPDNEPAIQGLAAFVDTVREQTGFDQVDLVAHSRGTAVSQAYLAVPEQAAEIRKYVNLDGRPADALPGGVPTLAVWSSLQPDGEIVGAKNVRLPGQGHTESATSAETFAAMYEFFTGRRPRTTAILPELPWRVEIEGRATLFPQNRGAGGTVEVWRIDRRNGARVSDTPVHSVPVESDGAFGPLRVFGGVHYEIALRRDGELTYHYYLEPLRRSDRFVRLQVSSPGGIGDYVDRCEGATTVTVTRNREWWGDQAGAGLNDELRFNGTDVLSPRVAPKAYQKLAAFVFDDGCDGESNLGTPVPPFGSLPFLTGVDVHLPAGDIAEPITVREVARGTGDRTTLTFPAWRSDRHSVNVQLNDW